VLGGLVGGGMAVLMALNLDGSLRWIGWLVVLLGLVAPTAGLTVIATLALFREPAGLDPLGFNATVIGACALGVTGRVMLGSLAQRTSSIRPEFVAIAAYLGLSAFQYLMIATRISDERELFAKRQLTDVAGGMLLMILVGAAVSRRGRPFLLAAVVPAILIAGIAAVASFSPAVLGALPIGGLLPAEDISARGTGIFRNPNYLGQAMAIGVLLLANARRLELPLGLGRRPWLGIITPLAGLVASFSRGALLSFVGGVVALYAGRGRRVFIVAALVGVLAVAVGYPLLLAARHAIIFGPDVGLSGQAQEISDGARLGVLKAGLKLFLSSPLTGIGYGQFHYESPKFVGTSPITYPHNIYLEITAEQGLLGIAAFLLVLLALFVTLSLRGDAYAITARAALVAFMIGCVFAEPLTSLQTSAILWLVVGSALVRTEDAEGDLPGPYDDRQTSVTERWAATRFA